MTLSVNPLQAALHNLYTQINNDVPYTKPGQMTSNALHNEGLTKGLLQNLRHDLNNVANGSNPDRALNNLFAGLQQLMPSTSDGGLAKEWPAGKEFPAGGRHVDLVKGEGGQSTVLDAAKEWPAGKEFPTGGRHLDLVKGEDGQSTVLDGAKEWPAGKEFPAGGKHLDLVKGEDGQPKQIEASDVQHSESENSTSSVQSYADAVVSNLKALLDSEVAGTGIAQASADLRSALQNLFNSTPLDSNPELVRNALRKAIHSQA